MTRRLQLHRLLLRIVGCPPCMPIEGLVGFVSIAPRSGAKVKCPPTIQLNAMQELWDMLSPDQPESEGEYQDTTEQFMVLLSQEAMSDTTVLQTFKLQGSLQGIELMILLDSGSSHSFLNSAHISSLTGISSLLHPMTVKVENGGLLQCTHELKMTSG